jgi:hypothetical protein
LVLPFLSSAFEVVAVMFIHEPMVMRVVMMPHFGGMMSAHEV